MFALRSGTQLKLHMLFFLSREIIIIYAQNRNLEKAHVSSKIVDAEERSASVAPD
jgi:hypothetical protein